ncbi:MAG: hydrogenase nickel incorporation protein HypB [Oscillospiraceae bacterium]|nr:hydrogenase nickel incorporation protein HypB [Oscillospiraceae bacterium]
MSLNIDMIEVRADLEEDNDRYALLVRELLRREGVCLINLMASPGAGKTSVLCRVIDALREQFSVGVMEADMDADVDAQTVAARGAVTVQLHTGVSCHMDAKMTLRGLDAFPKPLPDVVFLENVGNLVCPAEFDVGADWKLMILSVPEGDDKPLKYPLMFTVADCMLVNKIDTAPVFDFDLDRCENAVRALNPNVEIFPVSAKTGEGMDAFVRRLTARIDAALREKRGEKSQC